MNKDIIIQISKDLNIKDKQVETVLSLLSEGNTVPFIARYRKEATGALNEEVIRSINTVYEYQVNLLKRKEDVIRLIDEKGLLTDELKNSIMACQKLVDVEDLYRPYKEKKKTKATDAIANGLEPLSKLIFSFSDIDIYKEAEKYLSSKVATVDDAITGAKYIIAEIVSDNPKYRKEIRRLTYRDGTIISKIKKNANDEGKVYEMYYEFSERVNRIKPHRVLALNRGENEKVLSVSIDINKDTIISYLNKEIIKKENECGKLVKEAIIDSYDRLIKPSIEREIRSDLTDVAEDRAIENFSCNLEALLLTPPIKGHVVMGYDPGFRTGCKLAVVDPTGKLLDISVIYPTEPHNKIEESKKIVLDLIDKYSVDIIAIGNGTASRESEEFIANTIKDCSRKVEYVIVSEAGASVYSASDLAIKEFPTLTVEKRSAVSIARRIQDSLAELVKIDPKSIGVGLYQHDVTPKKLDESLNFVVTKAVNQVGVNINTASPSLLSYVSGMNKKAIEAIIDERNKTGKFTNRLEIKNIKGITPKVYEQSIGFIRILDGDNPLDKTGIHPDTYKETSILLKELNLSSNDIGTEKLKDSLKDFDINKYSEELKIDKYTLTDIVQDLIKPNRDPRDDMPRPVLRKDILKIEDLKIGDKLQGTVRNVVDFGAFIDIGLHNDGLCHVSKLSREYVKNPSDVVAVGDVVDCYVSDISLEKEKVSLSLFKD